MRKFRARWWVADPLAQYRVEMDAALRADALALEGIGFALRFIRGATAMDVRVALQWQRNPPREWLQ